MTDWSATASAIGALSLAVLGFIVNRLAAMDKKLDTKQDKTLCDANMRQCREVRIQSEARGCQETNEIWEALKTHSHTGLPPESKVTR